MIIRTLHDDKIVSTIDRMELPKTETNEILSYSPIPQKNRNMNSTARPIYKSTGASIARKERRTKES